MKAKEHVFAWLLGLGFLFAVPVQAGVVFYSNDLAGFTSAMTTSGSTLIGTETFEESTLAPGTLGGSIDPLTQGVPNDPFPSGLLQPMTVQSNELGEFAIAPNPGAGLGVGTMGDPNGSTSDVVVAFSDSDSLDWIFDAATKISGVGFNPLVFLPAGPLEVEVYDISNILLGSITIAGDETGTNFLGIQATAGDLIGRINLFSDRFEGGDNVMLFQVPEPAVLGLIGIGLAGLGFSRSRHS